jgi:phosphoglycolate phosphatase-like HAD superfamily hydrolase
MSSAHSKRPIKAIIFDLDNTLTDFMSAKANAVRAAADAMIDAGLKLDAEDVYARIFKIYDAVGIEHQRVFDKLLIDVLGHVDDRIMAAGVVAYRRAREAFLVPYPHVQYTLNRLLKEGYKLAVVSDAPRFEAWLRLCYLRLHHIFDVVLTYDDTKMRKPSAFPPGAGRTGRGALRSRDDRRLARTRYRGRRRGRSAHGLRALRRHLRFQRSQSAKGFRRPL